MTQSIATPEHLGDASFSLAIQVGTIGGPALATDPDPNVTPPGASRILTVTAKRGAIQSHGLGRVAIFIANGTSVAVAAWWYDDARLTWIPITNGSATLTYAGNNSTAVFAMNNAAGAKVFVQIVTNTGNVSWMGYDVV